MPLVDNVCKGKTFFAIMQIYFTLQVTEPPILGRFAVVFSVFARAAPKKEGQTKGKEKQCRNRSRYSIFHGSSHF
jgi:hypothetical protein